MPLEIRELVIKATVGDAAEDQQSSDVGGDGSRETSIDMNLIVEKVLEVLKERCER